MEASDTQTWHEIVSGIGTRFQHVLEISSSKESLAPIFRRHVTCDCWTIASIANNEKSDRPAEADFFMQIDLDRPRIETPTLPFDLILLRCDVELFATTKALVELLATICAPGCRMVAHFSNEANYARLLGSMNQDQPSIELAKLLTSGFSSVAKSLLDWGWLPDLVSGKWNDLPEAPLVQNLLQIAVSHGFSTEMAKLQLGRDDFWIVSSLIAQDDVEDRVSIPISVIVPVTRNWQLKSNLLSSPGLQEMNAEFLIVRQAASAAEAYAIGSAQAKHDWRLLVHQDVYFPMQSGARLSRQLQALALSKTVGAAGLLGIEAVDGSAPVSCRYAGRVVDRTRKYDFPRSKQAASVDEFAVAIHRDSPLTIDASLGWHLWATDLCIQAGQASRNSGLPVIDVPMLHNSIGAYSVPNEFYFSAMKLLEKHASHFDIPTVCGNLVRESNGSMRLEEPVRIAANV